MLPDVIIESVVEWFNQNGKNCTIINTTPVGGGSINEAFRVTTSCGTFFLKYNYADRYPQMFEVEIQGLALLISTNTVYVPEPVTARNSGIYSYLLMSYEEPDSRVNNYWDIFAKELAQLHKCTNENYGLDYDNFIGSLPQSNKKNANYNEFVILERFEPLVKLAVNQGFFSKEDINHFDSLYKNLNELFPVEKPSLIHGDLWSGNIMVNSFGKPCLIDPAVYYGSRESDIAMTKLFGGFPTRFYDAYDDTFPLIKGWEQRIQLHQLFPLLVHVNLFGSGYISQVRSIIRKY